MQKKRQSDPRDANVSVIRGEHESSSLDSEDCEEKLVKKIHIVTLCLYCSGMYTTVRRGGRYIKCTKCDKWCHEQRSVTDDWKTFLPVFCNTE